MTSPAASPAVQQALINATRALQSGNLAVAELALAAFFTAGLRANPDLLNIAGTLRMKQGRLGEAANLFAQAVKAAPHEAVFAFNEGRALAGLGAAVEAEAAFRTAIKRKPDFIEAFFELGTLLHRTGKLQDAEKIFRQLLRQTPDHAPAKLMLGAVLIDAGSPEDAETPLRRGLQEATEPDLKAALHNNLGLALRRQRKDAQALQEYDAAGALDPNLPQLAIHRSEALQNLNRHDEALEAFEQALARAPGDPALHHRYNDLLYRLGRKEEFLKSYDRAPQSRDLMLGKAYFLSQEKRNAQAHEIYRTLLSRDAHDPVAAVGAANALTMMRRYDEAGAAFDALLARHGGNPDLFRCAAEPALLCGDPQKALALCEQGLAMAPYDQPCLATKSVALRLMQDERDEILNGYDTLVRSFDLEPPKGFCDMESFNAELNASLDRLHPETREFINQSLRGGTQTPDHLFGTGHALVDALKQRIDEAMARYIAELGEDAAHPFLARRSKGFGYAGSWSSRLRDCGFHTNHIHPQGWISSCYYIALPEAVKDEAGRQGWIKFGEPTLDVALKTPIRRAIQPVPGRLVLFPSYMWHGTVPFHDKAARTTIAFDVVPS